MRIQRLGTVLGVGSGGPIRRAVLAGGQVVAVKPLRAELDEHRIELVATLEHPTIRRVHGTARHRWRTYLVMDLVDGCDLGALLDRRVAVHPSAALYIAVSVLRALRYAHERGVVHRDVSPANVLVRRDGTVLLGDFGVAGVEGAPSWNGKAAGRGTPGYAAPEQLQGADPDRRADLFAVGALLHRMITGRLPFAGTDTELRNVLASRVPIEPTSKRFPLVPDDLGAVIDRLIARDRDARYPSAAEVLADLERFAGELEPGRAELPELVPPPLASPRPWARRAAQTAVFALSVAIVGASIRIGMELESRAPANAAGVATPRSVSTALSGEMDGNNVCEVKEPEKSTSSVPLSVDDPSGGVTLTRHVQPATKRGANRYRARPEPRYLERHTDDPPDPSQTYQEGTTPGYGVH